MTRVTMGEVIVLLDIAEVLAFCGQMLQGDVGLLYLPAFDGAGFGRCATRLLGLFGSSMFPE